MTVSRVAALLAVLGVAASACSRAPYAISANDRKRFADGLIDVRVPGSAAPLVLGVDDCKLYRARYDGDRNIAGWDVTLAADWGGSYPAFMTACMNESLKWDGTYVRVSFCARAIGAGGGCTNGGNYRSKTGARPWFVEGNPNEWLVLPR